MTESQLLKQLRKAISDIDKSRLTHVAKFCMLANCLTDYRLVMWRHRKSSDVIAVFRQKAHDQEQDSRTEAPA